MLPAPALPAQTTAAAPAQPEPQAPAQAAIAGELELFALDKAVENLVLSSTKTAQPVNEAPSIASVLSRDQIQLYGYTTLNEVLYRQPGFAPSQDYERRTITARGFYEGWNNNHLLLLFDGLPINESELGVAFTMETMPLFLLKSMEILRGPGSALYGSNAINGVISLNSMSASDLQAPAIGMVRIGNQNTQVYDLIAGKEFKHFSFLAAYNYNTTDGYPYLDYDGSGRRDSAGALQQFTTRDARRGHYGLLKIEGNGALEGLSLQAHFLYYDGQTGHGWLWYVGDDDSEYIRQDRELVTLRYAPRVGRGKLSPDLVVRYERRGSNDHTRLYPSGTVFPQGLTEDIDTTYHDLFLRAQLKWQIRPGMSLIGGFEDTVFFYLGDRLHQSNVDINQGGTGQPFSPPGIYPLRPYLETLGSNPLNNAGIFLQYLSGRILRNYVSVTAGLRLDIQSFQYTDFNTAGSPQSSRINYAVSPRLAVLLFPHRYLTIKLIGNRAFRAPSLAELFGANTYLLGANPKTLNPETISVAEVGFDLNAIPSLILRANAFYQYLDQVISYAPTSNVFLNLYSRGVVGTEIEALAHVSYSRVGDFHGFGNYSFVQTVQESVPDGSGLSAHPGRLTWAPAHVFNIGLGYSGHGFTFSAQVHYQGEAQRRDSDMQVPENRSLRPDTVGAWATVDARVSYSPLAWLQLGLQASNLFNQQGYLIKPSDFPFDYRIDGVRVLGTLQVAAGPF